MHRECFACNLIAKTYEFLNRHVIKYAITRDTKRRKITRKVYVNRDETEYCIKSLNEKEKIEAEMKNEKHYLSYKENNSESSTLTELNLFIKKLIFVIRC